MDLHISLARRGGRDGLAGQIYQQIRSAILAGQLRPGEALPSTRELSARLEVARNTVTAAYDRLVAEGFLAGRTGAGTYVSRQLPSRQRPAGPARTATPQPRRLWQERPDPPAVPDQEFPYDFRPGLPDARRFPFGTWRALLAGAVRETEVGPGGYADPAGHPRLREAVARHVAVSRGVAVTPDDVLITSGIQQAVDLVGRVLLEPGDTVAVEDPGWWTPRELFRALGARVVPVPVDAEGLVVSALPATARLVYVTPSHQFPLGVPMSLPRRLALLAWAERAGAVILEDDYDSEFRYAGRPIEPVQSLDRGGRVVYVGSFSKTLLPMLRLGFCVSPPPLHAALRKAKFLSDWHTATPLQAALARFIDDGLLARHVRRMGRTYRDRRDRILTVLSREFVDLLAPVSSVAGLHLAARLPDRADQAVVERATRAGVGLFALSGFAVRDPKPSGLLLGFGVIPDERIEDGLRLLRAAVTGA